MTTPVCVRQRIRQLDRQGLSHREISRKLGVSRTTVVKYANHGDYSPKPLGSGHAGRSLVDAGYSAVVDGWLTADLRMPVKQRHTATRVYERLVAECGFTGSYSSVRRWVKCWRREHRMESDALPSWSGRGKRAGRFRPGQGRDCRSRTRGAFPGGVVPVFEHALGGCPSRRDLGVRVPGFAVDLRAHGHAPRVVVFDNATAWAIAGRTARPPRPACSPCSARITGSSRGSATRIPAMRRAVWRTPSASSGAT